MTHLARSPMLQKALFSLSSEENEVAIAELVAAFRRERADALVKAAELVNHYVLPQTGREARSVAENIRWDLGIRAQAELNIADRTAEEAKRRTPDDADTVVVDVQTLAKAAV